MRSIPGIFEHVYFSFSAGKRSLRSISRGQTQQCGFRAFLVVKQATVICLIAVCERDCEGRVVKVVITLMCRNHKTCKLLVIVYNKHKYKLGYAIFHLFM